MKKPKGKQRVFTVVFMLVITLVFISITTVIYTITEDTIKLNDSLFVKNAVLASSGISVPEDLKEAEKLYDERVNEIVNTTGNIIYYEIISSDTSAVDSYVLIATGPGLWGTITSSVGFERDNITIKGFEVIDQNETPGLGGRITENWFKKQFVGKKTPLETVPEGNPAEENEFQAITGATYSSNAIKNIINKASENSKELFGIHQ